MIGTPEQDDFLWRAGAGVVTTVRADGSPASSLIGYARIGDRLYFSTVAPSVKVKTLQRDQRLVLVAINETQPNAFVSVEGRATVHFDNPPTLLEQMWQYWERIARESSALRTMGRDAVWDMQTQPGRAIVEVEPVRVSGWIL